MVDRSQKARVDLLKGLIDELPGGTEQKNIANELFTLKSVECSEDLSNINVASDTSLFDKLRSIRLLDEPREGLTLDKVREMHKDILQKVINEEDVVIQNIEEQKYSNPPDIRMIKQLLDEGYVDAAKRVIDLINVEIRIHAVQIEEDPRGYGKHSDLERNFNLIRTFLHLFKQADKFKSLGKIEEESSIYLNLALYFQQQGRTWLWLCYEFYLMAIKACENYRADNGLTEATSRYVFGRFCFFRFPYMQEAIEHFSRACQLSAGRSWSASCITGYRDDYIYPSAHRLLYLAHIGIVLEEQVTTPKEILYHLQEAIILSTNEEEFVEVLIPLANAFSNMDSQREALLYLMRYIDYAKNNPKIPEDMSLNNMAFVRELELRFYFYNTKSNNEFQAIEHLYNAYRVTKWVKNMKYEADIYKYYGLIFLNKRYFSCANCMLRQAYRMYIAEDCRNDSESIAFVLAYHKFISYFRRYVELMTFVNNLEEHQLTYRIPECKEFFELIDNHVPLWKTYRQNADLPICDNRIPFKTLRDCKNFNKITKKEKLNKHEKIVMRVYHVERPKIKNILREMRRELYYKLKSQHLGKKVVYEPYKKKPKKRECPLVTYLREMMVNYKIPAELLTYWNTEQTDLKTKRKPAEPEDEASFFVDWQGMSSSDEEFYGRPIAGDPGSVNYQIPFTKPLGPESKLFHCRKHLPQDGKVYIPYRDDVSNLLAQVPDASNMYLVSDHPISIENMPDIPQDPESPLYEHQQDAKREFFYHYRDSIREILHEKFPDF